MMASCSESEPQDVKTNHTVIMFFPWGRNTYSPFLRNISQMEAAIASQGTLGRNELLVWIANSESTAVLFRIGVEQGQCVRDTLATYTEACPQGANDYTTDSGLASLMADIKRYAATDSYSLIIGSHGSGAIPRGCKFESATAKANRAKATIQTRWWGATSALPNYCIEVSTLAYALEHNAIYADYIYFDACYMGNVETAYALRHATHYLMASPAELLIVGSPYSTVGPKLLANNYEGALDAFLDYFKSTNNPSGTMSLIDCTKLDNLATAVRQICTTCSLDDSERDSMQAFDGLDQHVFFDLSDYITRLHPSADMLANYQEAMAQTVTYSVNTPTVISMYSGKNKITLSTNSGLSTMQPTQNNTVRAAMSQSAWWTATQE